MNNSNFGEAGAIPAGRLARRQRSNRVRNRLGQCTSDKDVNVVTASLLVGDASTLPGRMIMDALSHHRGDAVYALSAYVAIAVVRLQRAVISSEPTIG
ncbi:hypothetical protein [Mycobacterium sp. GA-2829]|uniref:hypothetical protein n=1 Tax=Mycobacterium sp. GA-2829 TaxID=1772283 RepID=UPI000A445F4E|nr:hypothetical protein [Mycobacterium sp. GA-2829]